jgi:hypothetical protein
MKCPNCGYTSFPHLESCRQCGHSFAEARELFGAYALPATPLDLRLAYETAPADTLGTTAVEAIPTPTVDVEERDAIDTAASSSGESASTDSARELIPTFDLDAEPMSPLPPVVSETDRPSENAPIAVDLDGLEGLTLELRQVAEDESVNPHDLTTSPPPSATDAPIFDLDDEASPCRDSALESAELDDAERAPPREYILEIDDRLELEVEEHEIEDVDDEDEDDDR